MHVSLYLWTKPSCTNMYMIPKSVMPRPAPKQRPPTKFGVRKPYAHNAIAGTPAGRVK